MLSMLLDLYRSVRVVIALWWEPLGICAEALNLAKDTGGIHWREECSNVQLELESGLLRHPGAYFLLLFCLSRIT